MEPCEIVRLWLRLEMLVALPSAVAFGQTSSLALTPSPTDASKLVLSIQSSAGSEPAAVQWTFTYPAANIADLYVVAGLNLLARGQMITCSSAPGVYTCIASGLSSNLFS